MDENKNLNVPDSEEPITEPILPKKPVVEEPVAEQPVPVEPAVEEPAAEPVAEEPAAEPIDEEPAAAEPAAEPIAEEPAPEEPVAEEPAPEEPAAEEPAPVAPVADNSKKPKEAKPKRSKKKIIWIFLFFFLLGAVCGVGYYLYSQGMLDDLLDKAKKVELFGGSDDGDEDASDDGENDEDEPTDGEDSDGDEDEPVDPDLDNQDTNTDELINNELVSPEKINNQQSPASDQHTTTHQNTVDDTPATEVTMEPPVTIHHEQQNTQPAYTMVTVTTNIPKAMVVVDGVDVGWAPWSGELTPGYHIFAVKAKNKAKLKTPDFNVKVSGNRTVVPINVPDPSVF